MDQDLNISPYGHISQVRAENAATSFDIHGYIPYLANRAATALVDQFQAGLAEHGIDRLDWRVLAILNRRGPTRLGVLASLAALERPTLSRVLARLTERGLVTRSQSDSDGRGVIIEPTGNAAPLVARILPHAQAVEHCATAGMTADEVRFLRSLLQRLCENLVPWVPED